MIKIYESIYTPSRGADSAQADGVIETAAPTAIQFDVASKTNWIFALSA
jgi:hypothetical protein